MRNLIRSYLANRGATSALLNLTRWIAWLWLGHPIAIAVFATTVIVGTPFMIALAVAIVVDGTFIAAGSVRRTPLGSLVWIWHETCRFRRRWPSAFADADDRLFQRVSPVAFDSIYSAPGGFRPVLSAPRLSPIPAGADGDAVTFGIRPRPDQVTGTLEHQIERIAQADRRVRSISYRPAGQRQTASITIEFRRPFQRANRDGFTIAPAEVADSVGGRAGVAEQRSESVRAGGERSARASVEPNTGDDDGPVVVVYHSMSAPIDSDGHVPPSAQRPPEAARPGTAPGADDGGRGRSDEPAVFVSSYEPRGPSLPAGGYATDRSLGGERRPGRAKRKPFGASLAICLPMVVAVAALLLSDGVNRLDVPAIGAAVLAAILLVAAEVIQRSSHDPDR